MTVDRPTGRRATPGLAKSDRALRPRNHDPSRITIAKKPASKTGMKAKRQHKATPTLSTFETQKPSPFLDLPAELRNLIYDFAVQHATATLRPNPRGKLTSNSSLLTVSRQLRDEYTSILYLSAPLITAHVRDMDFSHIVTFLNKLSDRELGALPSLNVLPQRRILVKLHITPACGLGSDMLNRWLLRCEHPTKKGTNLEVSYLVYGPHVYVPPPEAFHATNPLSPAFRDYKAGRLGPAPHPGTAVGEVWRAQKKVLRKLEGAEVRGRVCEELKKVVAALQMPRAEGA